MKVEDKKEDKKPSKEETSGGEWSDSDAFDSHPEMQDQYEEFSHDFFKKNDPEFYAIMKKAGLKDVDEEPTEED